MNIQNLPPFYPKLNSNDMKSNPKIIILVLSALLFVIVMSVQMCVFMLSIFG